MVKIPLGKNLFALVDDCDFDLLNTHSWCFNRRTGYAQGYDPQQGTITLHQLIGQRIGITDQVDHIHGDKLDCRRSQLREATNAQNQMNRHAVVSPTGLKGIYKATHGGYRAQITINKRTIHLGSSYNVDELIVLRKLAEKKYFGTFTQETP